MKYHELKSPTRNRKRVGRGISAGGGKTAGRGTKGQNSRTGGQRRPGFEGGQNPLYARLPKIPGFTSFKKPIQNITTAQLNLFKANTVVDNAKLSQAGLIKDPHHGVKLIFKGEVTKPFKIQVQAVSKQAAGVVVKAGGSIEIVERPKRITKKPNKK